VVWNRGSEKKGDVTMKQLAMTLAMATAAVAATWSAPTPAQAALEVAYINAAGGSVGYLAGYGINVTNINDPIGLTLADLAGYDAIMVASNAVFSQATNIGNVAAAFADTGRGVVLTEFCFQGQWAVGGAITGAGYSPFINDPLSSDYFISENLGTIYDAGSPLFAGVNPANVTTDYQADVGLAAGATLVADWAGGRHAFAYTTKVVALNLFPDSFYNTSADNQRLVANALYLSTNLSPPNVVPEPATIASAALAGFGGLGTLWRKKRRAAV
jgi:hypothetical protein